jgi:type III secretion system HrpE/YscL family protein
MIDFMRLEGGISMAAKIVKGKELKRRTGTEPKPAKRHVGMIADEGGVVDHRVISAGERAKRIIAEAEAEGSRIRQEAEAIRKDVTAVREQARKEGLAAGEAEGKSQFVEKLVELERKREQFFSSVEPEIVRLCLAAAEKVIGQIAAENPEVVRHVVRQALERSLGDRIMVRLNPEDHKAVTDEGYEFRDVLDRTKRIMFKEDDTIQKGGCVVETEVGTIDAQLETQLEAIRKALEV